LFIWKQDSFFAIFIELSGPIQTTLTKFQTLLPKIKILSRFLLKAKPGKHTYRPTLFISNFGKRDAAVKLFHYLLCSGRYKILTIHNYQQFCCNSSVSSHSSSFCAILKWICCKSCQHNINNSVNIDCFYNC